MPVILSNRDSCRTVRWGKSKCAALRWLCAWGCSSFDFAEALAFCLSFSVRFLSVVSIFMVAHNVCVSAVVPYRSRVLSHETRALNEDKTLIFLVTAPLQKHVVVRWFFLRYVVHIIPFSHISFVVKVNQECVPITVYGRI